MSQHDELNDALDADSILTWVDRIADQFDAAWQAALKGAKPPQIEDYVGTASEPRRSQLLCELLKLDVEYRHGQGESLDAADYLSRFAFLNSDWVRLAIASAEDSMPPTGEFLERTPANSAVARPDSEARPLSSELESTIIEPPSYRGSMNPVVEPPQRASEIPSPLGDYELRGELGRGGMGIVFRALQKSVNRIVALKVIRPDKLAKMTAASQKKAIERFRVEAEAAAKINHDNLVTVYEVGCEAGFHYFSMRYVEGSSLSELIRENPADNRQAAAWIEPVCRAVQAIHSQGILHRDLKPQNILLEQSTGRTLLADFGLAKFADVDIGLTVDGEVMGTPAYMPPEQFQDAANVDVAADVYSLGATLYCLLSGRPPFKTSSSLQTMRQVIDTEAVSLRQLNPAVDRDLETICMKCLEKLPQRRYASAELLADELKRYLDGRPILARPANRPEQVWRWCRRNVEQAVTIAVSTVTVVGTVIAALLWLTSAWRSEFAAHGKAERSRTVAVQRLTEARESVDLWLTTVGEQLRFVPGLAKEREQMLTLAEEDYAKFVAQESSDPELELERGRVLLRLGQVRRELGKTESAREAFQQARDLLERLEKNSASNNAAHLAGCDASIWLGLLLKDQQQFDEADHEFGRAIERLEQQRAAGTKTIHNGETLAVALFNRGSLWLRAGQLDRARPLIEQANALFAEIRFVKRADHRVDSLAATGLELLGAACLQSGSLAEADRFTKEAVDIFAELVRSQPWNLDWNASHGRALLQRAAVMQQLGRERDELACLEAAIVDYQAITLAHPDLQRYQQDFALSLVDAARLKLVQGDLAGADQLLTKALSQTDGLPPAIRNAAPVEQIVAHCQDIRGQVLAGLGHVAKAQEQLKAACDTFAELATANPKFPELNYGAALAQLHLAQVLRQQADNEGAESAFVVAVAQMQPLLVKGPVSAEYQFAAAFIASTFADFLHDREANAGSAAGDDRATAATEYARSQKLWRTLINNDKPAPDHVHEYVKFLLNCRDEGERDPAKALALMQQLIKSVPASANFWQTQGVAFLRSKQFAEAEQSLLAAIRERGDVQARDCYWLALAQHGLGKSADAQQSFERAEVWQRDHCPELFDLVRLRIEVAATLGTVKSAE